MARLQEEKLLDNRHPPSLRVTLVSLGPPPPTPTIPSPRPGSLPSLLPSPGRAAPTLLKRLSSDEIPWPRHHCASRVFLLIAEGEDEDPASNIVPIDPPNPPDPVDTPHPNLDKISFHSLAGHSAPKTLRLLGSISNHQVVVLVDGGSTHNFIQQELVVQLNLPCRETPFPLRVMVGNSQQLLCTSLCEMVSLTIQSTQFIVDLHVLPISGANIVLGVQWLKSLGLVLTNYNTLSMQFFYQG